MVVQSGVFFTTNGHQKCGGRKKKEQKKSLQPHRGSRQNFMCHCGRHMTLRPPWPMNYTITILHCSKSTGRGQISRKGTLKSLNECLHVP